MGDVFLTPEHGAWWEGGGGCAEGGNGRTHGTLAAIGAALTSERTTLWFADGIKR